MVLSSKIKGLNYGASLLGLPKSIYYIYIYIRDLHAYHRLTQRLAPVGAIAQLVEYCTGIPKVRVRIPVQARFLATTKATLKTARNIHIQSFCYR